jgi:hypothetical protein
VIAAIKVELCTLQRAAGPRGLRGPRPRFSLPLRSTGHQWDARPKTQVRRKLAAGGKRIRTPGPTLTKVSVGVLPKGDPGTTGWGPCIKLWSSREMAIGCAPSPRPVHGEAEISNLVCSGREPELSVLLARDDTGVRNNLPPAARVQLRYQFPTSPAIVNEAGAADRDTGGMPRESARLRRSPSSGDGLEAGK